MVGIGARAEATVGMLCHDTRACVGVVVGNGERGYWTLDDEPLRGGDAERAREYPDARRGICGPDTERWRRAEILGAGCREMVGIGDRAEATVGLFGHDTQACEGVLAGNQRRPRPNATPTRRMRTGTSTRGPMTASKATGEARPKAANAPAIAH